MTAPQCPISHNGPLQSTWATQPGGATVAIPPAAHDLRTAIIAINRLNNVVQTVTHMPPQINNIGTPYTKPQVPGYGRVTWQEAGRSYVEEELVNPDDDSQKIKLTTLAHVAWVETFSGHQLVYQKY